MLNGKYFEYNIPQVMPMYINHKVKPEWRKFYDKVSARFELLQEALEESGLRGEDFAFAAQKLFDKENPYPALDTFDPDSLAELCNGLSCSFEHQPDRMVWPNANTVCDTAFLTTKEWEFLRSIGIGGSEAAAISGCSSAYTTPRSVWNLKVHTDVNPYYRMKDDPTFIFAYGHCVENLVIETFLRLNQATRVPETRMFSHKDYPWLIADMDGVITMPDGKLYLFEAKTTNWRNSKLWEEGCIPPQYDPQCRHYMGVMNDPRVQGCYIAVIYGNSEQQFKSTLVERDIPTEEDQNDTVTAFWNKYILTGVEPPLSGNGEVNFAEIQKYHGKGDTSLPKTEIVSDKLCELLRNAEQIRNNRLEHDHESKRLKAEEDRYNSQIADAMGQCTEAVIADARGDYRYSVNWSSSIDYAASVPKLKKQFPQAFQDCFVPHEKTDIYVKSTSGTTPGMLDITALKAKYPDAYDTVVRESEKRSFKSSVMTSVNN